ncbi:MAG: hypothetical protein ACRYFZ_00965 [Janthinobacterium lividum]
MANKTKKAGSKGGKKTKTKAASKAKKGRVKLSPEHATQARKMLRQIREWQEEAKNGKKGSQRKLVF